MTKVLQSGLLSNIETPLACVYEASMQPLCYSKSKRPSDCRVLTEVCMLLQLNFGSKILALIMTLRQMAQAVDVWCCSPRKIQTYVACSVSRESLRLGHSCSDVLSPSKLLNVNAYVPPLSL